MTTSAWHGGSGERGSLPGSVAAPLIWGKSGAESPCVPEGPCVSLRGLVYPCRGGTRVPCPAASGLRASSWRVRGCQARRRWLVSPGWDWEGRCLPPAGIHLKPCNVRTFPSSSALPPWLGQPVLFLRWKERG